MEGFDKNHIDAIINKNKENKCDLLVSMVNQTHKSELNLGICLEI